jgi:hypothetical protein
MNSSFLFPLTLTLSLREREFVEMPSQSAWGI